MSITTPTTASAPLDRQYRIYSVAIPNAEPKAIVKNPRVLHAEPILEGTRIPVRTVVQLMRLHHDISAVQRELPALTVANIADDDESLRYNRTRLSPFTVSRR